MPPAAHGHEFESLSGGQAWQRPIMMAARPGPTEAPIFRVTVRHGSSSRPTLHLGPARVSEPPGRQRPGEVGVSPALPRRRSTLVMRSYY